MSLFVVKNDKGEWLSFDSSRESVWYTNNPTFFNDRSYAEAQAGPYGHVVELVEAPAKIVVSEEEAEMLERTKSREEYPAKFIHRYVYDSHNFSEWDYYREIRLMRAYVNGWTVDKPKRWNVKVPLVQAQGGLWFFINSEDKLDATWLQELAKKFTMDEIEENGLQDCEKTEVTDNEQ